MMRWRARSGGLLSGVGGMRRRAIMFVCALACVFSAHAVPAFAWCNGPAGGDSYGTHDWILDQAIRLAGPAGSWITTDVALRATDDPDSDGTSKRLHVLYERGVIGGAAQMVTDHYYEAVTAYRSGDTIRASTEIGLLAHYYGDILNPFHSAAAASRSSLHAAYEQPVDNLTSNLDAHQDWITPRGIRTLVDIRRAAGSAAAFSRARYPALRASYVSSGTVDVNLPAVRKLTIAVLDRAALDLADIVAAVSSGKGVSPPPAVVKADMSRHRPAQGSLACAKATCRDAKGRAVYGACVVFAWPSVDGNVTDVRYTDTKGIARSYRRIGLQPLGTRVNVVMTAAASGAATVRSTWYAPSFGLAAGSRGIKTTVSNTRPRRRTRVTATTTIHDIAGHPVAGRRITFTWKFRTKTVTTAAVTDAAGSARSTVNIGPARRGFRVSVNGRITATVPRSATATFVPR
jgi:hypothetical protein